MKLMKCFRLRAGDVDKLIECLPTNQEAVEESIAQQKLTFLRWNHENQKLKVTLGYIVSSQPTCAR